MRRASISISLWITAFLIFTSFSLLAFAHNDSSAVPKSAGKKNHATVPKPALDGFDDFMAQVLKDWKVPGVAVGVVQNGKMILLKGYGYRDVEKQLPVTPNTLFAVGSITKSFTVTLLGMEMDEGKVDWDKPVRNYLPDFRMYDPVLSEQMLVRDLITHRSGLPRHDMVWYSSDFTREDLLRRLEFLEPNKPLRSRFQYNNLMFMTAGYIAGKLNGKSWEDSVRERILLPLGMNRTTFSEKESQNAPDFAQPYQKGNDVKSDVKRMPFDEQCPDTCALGPAGEINSSVADMSRYVLLHLNKGKLEGKTLLSENNAIQMQTPQMVIQGAPDFKEQSENSYGMGFFISSYRGHKQVEHGGNIDGFSAEMIFLPGDGIGVVVLTNLDGTAVPYVVANNLLDRLLGMDQVPWSQRYLDQEMKAKESEEEAKNKNYTPHKSGTHPSHDGKEYSGDYGNPGYGVVSIAEEGDHFKMTINRVTKSLEHLHYDVFQVPDNPFDQFAKLRVMFLSDANGDISSLSMPLETNVKDIVFTRLPDKQLTERSFIEQFTGPYELPGSPTPFTISLRGEHTLILSSPGSPEVELIPKRGTTFDLKDQSGVSLEFKRDAAQKVVEAALSDNGTTVVLKRK
jgi:CubicO group peptidase (beta-lactamase class C family)